MALDPQIMQAYAMRLLQPQQQAGGSWASALNAGLQPILGAMLLKRADQQQHDKQAATVAQLLQTPGLSDTQKSIIQSNPDMADKLTAALIAQKPASPIATHPGETLVDPSTYKPLYTAPPDTSKAPTTRTVPVGDQEEVQQWNPATSSWDTVSKASRFAPREAPAPISVAPGSTLYDRRTGKPIFTAPGSDAAQAPIEVYDPTSPTFTKFVSRADAVGKPGKPASGMTVYGPDGKPIVETGGGRGGGPSGQVVGGSSALTKSEAAKTQDAILQLDQRSARLDAIAKSFDPAFLTYGPRINAAIEGQKSKLGMTLDPASEQGLQKFSEFKRSSAQELNQTLHDMSGSAVTPSEYDRQVQALPNAGTGMFDGDNPVDFQAKLKGTIEFVKQARRRYALALAEGIQVGGDASKLPSVAQVDKTSIDHAMTDYLAKVQETMAAQGATQEQIGQQIAHIVNTVNGGG